MTSSQIFTSVTSGMTPLPDEVLLGGSGGHIFWETTIRLARLLVFAMLLLIKSHHTRPSRTRLCFGEYSCGILLIRQGLQGQERTSTIFLVFNVLASGYQIFTRLAEQSFLAVLQKSNFMLVSALISREKAMCLLYKYLSSILHVPGLGDNGE